MTARRPARTGRFCPRLERLDDRVTPTAGAIDTTFGTGGTVNFNFAWTDSCSASALQADGKIVVAGGTWTGAVSGGHTDFALARFDPDGSLDTTFGTGGRVRTELSTYSESVRSVVIQPDGKIVAGGQVQINGGDYRFALVRYNPDGSLDTGFGTGGVVTTLIGSGANLVALALQPDGKVLAGGGNNLSPSSSTSYFALARYTTTGALDPTFGSGGVVSHSVGGGTSGINRLALQPDGRIVAAGLTDAVSTSSQFVLTRYLPNGTLDTSFDGDGKVTTTFPGASAGDARGLALQPDGKIVAGGVILNVASFQADLGLARYNPDGSLDSTFDGDGRVSLDLGYNDDIDGIALQADGKVVAVGSRGNPGGSWAHVTRFLPNGALDTGFGTNGSTFTKFEPNSSNDGFTNVLIQPDGRILATGNVGSGSDSNFALARYQPGGLIVVGPLAPLVTTEAGVARQFSVALLNTPTADVTFALPAPPAGEGLLSTSSLTFTPADALTPQTVIVTGLDDPYDDGDVTYTIPIIGTSADADFNNLRAAAVRVTNADDDTAGVTVSPTTGLTTTEASGGSVQFTVVLTCQPRADVTIGLSTTSPENGGPTVSSLTFTTANWSVPQTVTVTGLDDPYDDGDVLFSVVTAPATSTDPAYNGLNAPDVQVRNIDNDTAGVTVTPTGGLVTSEAGSPPVQFTLVLTCQPRANVTIGLSSSSPADGGPTVSSVVFTPANWSVTQTVTVNGADDQVDDDDVFFNVVTAPATSTDPAYSGLNAADVQVQNIDNDTAGITVTPTTGLTTTEAGGTAQFTVQMLTIPRTTVTISLSSSDTTEGTVSPTSLTFAANSSALTPRTVTITGVNDTIVDGNISYTIVTGAAVSTDPKYSGMAVPDVWSRIRTTIRPASSFILRAPC